MFLPPAISVCRSFPRVPAVQNGNPHIVKLGGMHFTLTSCWVMVVLVTSFLINAIDFGYSGIMQQRVNKVQLLQMLRQNSYARWKQERKHKSDNKKEMDAEGSSSQRKRSKFSDKLDVVVMKAEVEVRIEASLKTEEQPKRVEQNGIEGERTEDNMSNNIKKEPDVVDSQDADICSNVHVETKEAQIEGTHCIMETKEMDAEMTEAAGTTDPMEVPNPMHIVETYCSTYVPIIKHVCIF